MKVFVAILLLLLAGVGIGYASRTLYQSPDTTVKPILWCGKQSDGTITIVQVESDGTVVTS